MGKQDERLHVGCSAFLALWLSFWTAIVMLFNVTCVSGLIAQYRAQTYPSAPGSITLSEIIPGDSDSRPSPKIEYEYFVGKEKLQGDQISFGTFQNSMEEARDVVSRYPAGSERQVYYDPDRPANSALEIRFNAMDFFMPLFLVPFNMITLGGWYALIGATLRGWLKRPPMGTRAHDNGLTYSVRLRDADPVLTAMFGAGIAGFVGTFVCGFGQFALPLAPLLVVSWCAVFATALYAWSRCSANSVELDQTKGKLHVRIGREEQTVETLQIRSVATTNSIDSNRSKSGIVINMIKGESLDVPCSKAAAKWLKKQLDDRLRLRRR